MNPTCPRCQQLMSVDDNFPVSIMKIYHHKDDQCKMSAMYVDGTPFSHSLSMKIGERSYELKWYADIAETKVLSFDHESGVLQREPLSVTYEVLPLLPFDISSERLATLLTFL